jgi:1,2-diacylglycerol 3-alpha-glucosyltransferase
MLCVKKDIIEFIKEIGHVKRIAILNKIFVEGDVVSHTIKEQVKELTKMGYDVTIFTLESNIKINAKIRILGSPKNFILKRIYWLLFLFDPRLVKWSRELKDFDLIIVHTSPLTYLAYLAKKRYKKTCCLYDHGEPLHYKDFKLIYPKLIERIYVMTMYKLMYLPTRNFDYFIANSIFSAKILQYRLRVKDIAIIYPKIDENRFKKELKRGVIREKYGLGDSPLLLFVGRIVPSKGIHLLIEAFRLVKQEVPSVKLIIVGNPYYKDYFIKLKSIADDSVIFASLVSEEDLPYYYADCDLYVTCSLWEGFNRPLVEAQMCGKPVVAFDIGSHKEVSKMEFLIERGNLREFSRKIIDVLRTKYVRMT